MARFLTIVITSPDRVVDETAKIVKLLDIGVDYVHIRKPEWSIRDVKNLIEEIPYQYRNRLRLHGHFDLVNEMNLAGVQINNRNPEPPRCARSITASCHSVKEARNHSNLDYVTLSPIFDSISKQGYCAKFDLNNIKPEISSLKVVALGGVRPEQFSLLYEKGFYGAALLGYIWNNDFDASLKSIAKAIVDIRQK